MGRSTELDARDAAIRSSTFAVSRLAAEHGISEASVHRIRAGVPRVPTRRERFQLVLDGGWKAACMEPDEWEHWVALNPIHLADAQLADRPCRDCPASFAADMRAIGRCNGNPTGSVGEPADHDEDDVTEPVPTPLAPPSLEVPAAAVQPEPAQRVPSRQEARLAKVAQYLAAIRATSDHGAAARRLGVTKHTVEQFVSELRHRGEMPDDVDQLLRARNPLNNHNRQTAAQEPARDVATPPGPPDPPPGGDEDHGPALQVVHARGRVFDPPEGRVRAEPPAADEPGSGGHVRPARDRGHLHPLHGATMRIAVAATWADLVTFLGMVALAGPAAEANPLARMALAGGVAGIVAALVAKGAVMIALTAWPGAVSRGSRSTWLSRRTHRPIWLAGLLVGAIGAASNLRAVMA